jgi:two-component system invasion response regulator UvrY
MEKKPPITLAYVEDHDSVREGIILLIEKTGQLKVEFETGNGYELLAQLGQTQKLPDVCIIDISMPQMDGFTLVDEIKRRWKEMKILILTAYTDEYFIIKMIRKGANGYLVKGCSSEAIRNAIYDIHESGYYYSEEANSKVFAMVQKKQVKFNDFTKRDLEFMKHCCSDMTYVDIARLMGTTERSVAGYRDKLFSKFGINSRVSLAMLAMRIGVLGLDGSAPINNYTKL